MRTKTLAPALALLVVVALPAAAAAQSAPEYVSSEPEDGATLHRAPRQVSVTFSEPLDPSSTMTVADECGRDVDADDVTVEGNEMRVSISESPAGPYHVSYEAVGVGGITGTNEGHFSFEVHMGPSCKGSDKDNDHDHGDGDGEGDKGGGDHDGHRGGGGNGGDHDAHDGSAGADHSTGDHDDGTHTGMGSGDHAGHRDAAGMSKRHPHSPDHGHHRDGRDGPPDIPNLASGDDGSGVLNRPQGTDVIAALGLASIIGAIGGGLLRASATR